MLLTIDIRRVGIDPFAVALAGDIDLIPLRTYLRSQVQRLVVLTRKTDTAIHVDVVGAFANQHEVVGELTTLQIEL